MDGTIRPGQHVDPQPLPIDGQAPHPAAVVDEVALDPGISRVLDHDALPSQIGAVDDVRHDAADAGAQHHLLGGEGHAPEGPQVLVEGGDEILWPAVGVIRGDSTSPGPVPLPWVKGSLVHVRRNGQIECAFRVRWLARTRGGRRVPGFQEAPGTRTHRGTAAVDGTDHAQSRKRFVGLHDAGAGDPVGLGKAAGGGKWVVIQETAIGDGSEDGRDHPLGDGVDLRVHDEMWVQLRCSPGHG